jgi:serine protease inhibitor
MTNTSTVATSANPTVGFGVSLFQKEVINGKGKNVLISPASVAIALAMTMNGARTATLAAMKATLGYGEEQTIEAINATVGSIIAAITDPTSGVQLNVANAIWAEKSMTFNPAFLASVVDAYKATVTTADFSDDATKDAINKWASDNTNEKIPTIIDEISPDMVMYLLNAIYFKGSWTNEFDKDRTWDDTFVAEDGSKKSVPFMFRDDEMSYARGADYQAIALPFGTSERINLCVLVPNKGVDINDFIAGMTAETVDAAMSGYKQEAVLRLPRFKVESDLDLKDSLIDLGMGSAFHGADFSGMADAELVISSVKHKTFAKFDEEGGEAAAVTAVGIAMECVRMTPTVVADRPFVITLVDTQTKTLLFAGKVATVEA